MCYAIPAKIIKIKGDDAEVDYGGVLKKAKINLIDSPKIGDFVLIHAGFAIEKFEKKTAEAALKSIRLYISESEK